MELTSANLAMVYTGIKTAFMTGQKTATAQYQGLANVVPSGTSVEQYPILSLPGKMQEWIGSRKFKDISANGLSVKNREFTDGFEITRPQYRDNQLGWVGMAATALGVSADNLWDDLLTAAKVANGKWLDGADFFGTTRKYGKNVISNKVTSALTPTTYAAARIAMMSYLDHEGAGLGVVPDTLEVGPALEAMANRIAINDFWYDATDKVQINNPYKGQVKVVVNSRLVGTAANYWFLQDCRGSIKPCLVQKREEPTITRQDRPTDDCVFVDNKLRYAAQASGEAALAIPHLIYAGIV